MRAAAAPQGPFPGRTPRCPPAIASLGVALLLAPPRLATVDPADLFACRDVVLQRTCYAGGTLGGVRLPAACGALFPAD